MSESTEATAADEHTPEGTDYVSDRRFADFPISSDTLKGVLELGYETATPVQAATIEAAIAGRDMLVRAKTGTGKTTAFALPMIERIPDGARQASGIILAPTRELAQQIAEEASGLCKHRDVTVATLVGGLAIGPQEKALNRGAELIVGTPGRVLDHLKRGNLDASHVVTICLDEADEMVSQGFYEDVTAIIDFTPKGRQVLLFSATISSETQRLVDHYLKDPENIRLSTDADNVNLITHVIYETDPGVHKVRSLLYLLDNEEATSAIIFCNTREDTTTVARFLDRQGLDVQLISGELSQARRSAVMKLVKAGSVRFLVATDVAARGIDISDLSHVINYSLPFDASVYLHRAGRTGRIGKQGTCISLVGGTDLSTRKTLVTQHEIDFENRELPDAETAARKRVDRQAEEIKDAMGKMVFEAYLPTVRALKERPDGDALLAACIRTFFTWNREQKAQESGTTTLSDMRREEESARGESRGRDGGKGRGRSDRKTRSKSGGSRDRGGRNKSKSKSEDIVDDLDALLVADDSPPKKKRSKSKSKSKRSSDKASKASSKSGGDLDDLDALLSAD